MTRSEQKARERRIVEYYLRTIRGSLYDSETPDFIFCYRNQRIGIEILEYYRPQGAGEKFAPMTAQDTLNKLIATAHSYRSHPDNHDIKNLRVSMRFKNEFPPNKCHCMFIDAVYSKIRSYELPNDGQFVEINVDDEHPPILVRYLSKLKIAKSEVYLDWHCQDIIQTANMNDEYLIKIISDKCNKQFIGTLDALHLIIWGYGAYEFQYAGDTSERNVSSWHEFNSLLASSPFDVVAIINPPESVVWRKTTRKWKKL